MSPFLQKLQNTITNASSADELLHFCRHIPLASLKNLIDESFKSMDEDKVRSIYYQASSIEDVLPSDIIQSTLSYLPYQHSIECVNKSFWQMGGKIEELDNRSRDQMIATHFNGDNQWTLHQEPDEIRRSIKHLYLKKNDEPKKHVQSLEKVFDLMESGDKLILNEGKYTFTKEYEFDAESIQIEGIGQCTIARDEEKGAGCLSINANKIINIKSVHFANVYLRVMEQGTLYLTDCSFDYSAGAMVEKGGSLDCSSCFFNDCTEASSIYAYGPCNLCVTNCKFDDHRLKEGNYYVTLQNKDKIDLKLGRNTFCCPEAMWIFEDDRWRIANRFKCCENRSVFFRPITAYN